MKSSRPGVWGRESYFKFDQMSLLVGGLGMDRKRENRAIHILFNLC